MDKHEATEAIEQILQPDGTVADWEIEDVDVSKDSVAVECIIKHSRGFNAVTRHNVNGFNSIEFTKLYTTDNVDGIRYFVMLV